MIKDKSFDQLWNAPAGQGAPFISEQLADMPVAARRYIGRAIAQGTPMASVVHLQMHGEIRLKTTWCPFDGDQLIRWDRGFVWRAKVRVKGLPVTGFDRYIDGQGSMCWRLLGILPIVSESGVDVSRSAAGRMLMEAIWLPSALLDTGITWEEQDATHLLVGMVLRGQYEHFELSLNEQGQIRSVSMLRWGNPEKYGYDALPFGGMVEEERTFGGFTIPAKLRIGWYFGTNRFETEGEFFRCIIDNAIYR